MSSTEATRKTISQLFDEAVACYLRNEQQLAFASAREAVALARTYFGENSAEYAKALNDFGVVVSGPDAENAELDQARQLYEKALAIQAEVTGTQNWNYAVFLLNLGELCLRLPDLEGAERCLVESYRLFGTLDSDQAEPVFQLDVGYGFGPASEASVSFTVPGPAGEVVEVEPSKPALQLEMNQRLTHALHNLATLHQQQGDYRRAIPLYESSLDLKRRIYVDDYDPMVTNSLVELGWVHHSVGNYEVAKSVMTKALQNVRHWNEEFQLGDSGVSSLLNDLAVVNYESGDYATGMRLMRQALDLDRGASGDDQTQVARDLEHLGWLHYGIGNYADAESCYQRALAIEQADMEGETLSVGSIYHRLGLVRLGQGQYESAEHLLEEAFRISAMHLPEDHPTLAEIRHSLAILYQDLGDFGRAESMLYNALDILRLSRGNSHPYVSGVLSDLGRLAAARGDYSTAETYYQQALEIDYDVLGENHPNVAETKASLARLCTATGRLPAAKQLWDEVTRAEDQMIDQVFSVGAEGQRAAYLDVTRGHFYAFLSLVLRHLSHDLTSVEAAFELTLRRKWIGAEAMAVQRHSVLGERCPPELAHKFAELTTLRLQIAKKTLSGPGPEGLPGHEQLLEMWRNQQVRLEAELAEQIPEMKLFQRMTINRHSIAAALPVDTALVEVINFLEHDAAAIPADGSSFWRPRRYLVFVILANRPREIQMVDLGPADVVDQLIANFRETVTGSSENRDAGLDPEEAVPFKGHADSVGSTLRATIFDPLLPALGNCRRVFLSPDGSLTQIPFEILPIADGKRLIDEYRFSYLNVGRDVLRFGTKLPGQPNAPLVMANPDFDLTVSTSQVTLGASRQSKDIAQAGFPFKPLPGTEAEGKALAGILGVSTETGRAALEGTLKRCRSPRLLHLATHGFFLQDQLQEPDGALRGFDPRQAVAHSRLGRLGRLENPLLRSGLALAGANTWNAGQPLPAEAEDGILTAEDVSGLDLLATELVVLSACETGLGQVQAGEGVFGLGRAFVLAGARTLVMSLWKVPDAQTQELMIDFYRRILAGESRADALRQAQLNLKQKYPHPRYWGAFICQGEPGPLIIK